MRNFEDLEVWKSSRELTKLSNFIQALKTSKFKGNKYKQF